jgi:Zn-dependent protease
VPDLSITGLLVRAIAGLLGLTLHEAAHAWTAYQLGDSTAARQGRLTLNPRAHLDPFGYILVVLFGFGWARPVPVSPWNLRYGPRIGNALVAGAGPLTNLLIAIVVALPWRLGLLSHASPLVLEIVYGIIAINIALFVFNLIPLAPLDGSSVLAGFIGDRAAMALARFQVYGPQVLMGLLLIGFIAPQFNILGKVLYPAMANLTRLVLGI